MLDNEVISISSSFALAFLLSILIVKKLLIAAHCGHLTF